MEPNKIKQGVALIEVSTTPEFPEEIDISQVACKGVGINKLAVLPFIEDNHHHGTIILHDFEDPPAEEEC